MQTIPSLTITTISSDDATGSHNVVIGSHDIPGSHDTSDKALDTNDKALGSCDSSDAPTTESDDETIVDQRTNLKQINIKRGVSGSHDTESDSSSTAEGSSHDSGRSTILNKIYRKYVKDTTRTQKTRRLRKKKVITSCVS